MLCYLNHMLMLYQLFLKCITFMYIYMHWSKFESNEVCKWVKYSKQMWITQSQIWMHLLNVERDTVYKLQLYLTFGEMKWKDLVSWIYVKWNENSLKSIDTI